jgi:hypothetical protein
MIVFNEQQRQELAAAQPLAFDPQTNETYVLVRKAVYDKMRRLLENGEPDMREVAVLVDRAMAEDDLGDPTLAYYQQKYGRTA